MCGKAIVNILFLWCFVQIISIVHANDQQSSTSKPLWNSTWTDILKRDLLMSYDKFSRPTEHYNDTTVELGLKIRHIDIDEEKSIFTVFAWLSMVWQDEKLKWNESQYGNLSILHLGNHEIWQPDILLYNSATGSDVDHYGSTHVLVYGNGEVLWVPPATFQSFCEIDIRYWPFDTQQCTLILGSWTFNRNQVDLRVKNGSFIDDLILQNSQWDIVKTSSERNVKKYACCDEEYVDIKFNVTLIRRSPTYRAVVIVPATVIILMTLATFWLPPHYGEKILLNGVNLIIVVMFLIYFAQRLTTMSAQTPLIVLFYSNTLYLVTFSTLISVIVINLTRYKQDRPVPWVIKKNLDGPIGQFLFIKRFNAQTQNIQHAEELRDPPFDEHVTSDDHHIIQSNNVKTPLQQDWILFATAIDRVAFLLYTCIFAFSAIVYSL